MVVGKVHVLVADENEFLRAGICASLSDKGDSFLLDEVGDLAHLQDRLNFQELPNILILNAAFDKQMRLISELSTTYPNLKIIVMGQAPEESCAARMLRGGAAAYLRLDCGFEELLNAVTAVCTGRIYLTHKASAAVLDQLHNRNELTTLHCQLSDRENQIFMMICTGMPLTKIGQTFGISVKTVSTYRSRILKKMNMSNNAELVQYAVKYKLLAEAA